jgi:multiple sugar transport system permease protein
MICSSKQLSHPQLRQLSRRRRGIVPLWMMIAVAIAGLVLLIIWTRRQTSDVTSDGREMIVFWGHKNLGEDVETLLHRFEERNPQYKVVMSNAVARDLTGDAQRLVCAIAGGVPPDLVYFDRFAIGEWAARGAFSDLRPMLDAQRADDPYRINLDDYYKFSVDEASYRPPGTNQRPGIYGVPQSTDIRMLWCNSDVLRQAGFVDEHGNPRPPRDWDELRDYANKLTIYRVPGDKKSGIIRLGFAPNSGNSWLYMYAWQAGGELMNPARTRVTMDSPPVVRALRYMTDVYDDLGGVGQVKAFEEAQQAGALDPFILGKLALKIDGDWMMAGIADWKPDMEFTCSPAPLPRDRAAAGAPPVAWSGGFAFVIPSTARQKQGAFKLLQYLRSWEALQILERGRREQREAEGRIYLPRLEVNQVYCEKMIKQYIDDNPALPPPFKRAYSVVRQLLPHTMIRPVTPVGQMLWTYHVRAFDAGTRHAFAEEARSTGQDEIELALRKMQAPVQADLDKLLRPPPPVVVNWRPYLWLYGVLVALPFAGMWLVYRRHRRQHGYRAGEVGAAMLFSSPWLIGFVVLVGGPILFSIVFSFTQYDVLSAARYVGVKNYVDVFNDRVFYVSLANTLFMVIAIPLTMIVSLAIALLLNHAVRGIGFYRAAFYMPAIVPLVAASLMWVWVFNPSYGMINGMLAWILDTAPLRAIQSLISHCTAEPFHFALPLWLQDPNWSKPSLILMKLWAAGGGMIIWLAGLQSIPQELYEAAKVDGASTWQRFRNVTIPMLSPFILFNLIIGLIGTMQIFAESYIMTEGGPNDSTLFYAYYLFKQAFQFFHMGYASALAWILFVVVMLLTLTQLWLSRKWVHYEQA